MKPPVTSDSLRELLRERGLTYEATGVLAGLDTSGAWRVVNGKRQPRPETVVRLARALGISPRRLQDMAAAAWNAEHRDGEAVAS